MKDMAQRMKARNLFGKIKNSLYEEIDRYVAEHSYTYQPKPTTHYSQEPPVHHSEEPPRPKVRPFEPKYDTDLAKRLNYILSVKPVTFSDELLRIIDQKHMTDAQVYNRAHISRQLFNSIKNVSYYRPSKQTVLALLCALELSIEESRRLLEKAGFAFSSSNKSDLIIKFCIENGIYSITDINEILAHYNLPLLGSE